MSLASITHGHILLFTVTEAILSFTYLPQLSPDSTLSGIFFLFASVNWGLWAIWKTLIYPFFYSPFRNLPKPKTVGKIAPTTFILSLTFESGVYHSSAMDSVSSDNRSVKCT